MAQPGDLTALLLAEDRDALLADVYEFGDARRGAVVFHQQAMACGKCHAVDEGPAVLGPNLADLASLPEPVSDAHLVEAVLEPSRTIRKGFEPVVLALIDGRQITGLLLEETADALVMRVVDSASVEGSVLVTVPSGDIDERAMSTMSIMPAGQMNTLTSRQQFLDLISYLIAIRDGGPARAQELQPPLQLLALVLPEYEAHVDHAGMIAALDDAAFERGEQIYKRLCINCHGDHSGPGSLPTALRFGDGRFKNGSDPHAMYRTLTHGFGLMVPQTWMVPQQKYDVIHYIREEYLRDRNASQHFEISGEYLAGLPPGDTHGPEPVLYEPWVTMDYGPYLVNTYEVGSGGGNFAYKGIAVRLDAGPGGVSNGRAWMVFDHDTLRVAAAWTADEGQPPFIDWNGIHFNGAHQTHPRVSGVVQFANPTGPGWADPVTGEFVDDQRVEGRDGRRYGPLPRAWGKYHGLYRDGDEIVIAYEVAGSQVLEQPGLTWLTLETTDTASTGTSVLSTSASSETGQPVFLRRVEMGPRAQPMTLLVASHPAQGSAEMQPLAGVDGEHSQQIIFGSVDSDEPADSAPRLAFDGQTFIQIDEGSEFDLSEHDFTIAARIRTEEGGTIFAKTVAETEWVPDGQTFFVRGGRLCFDIGWVGVVESRQTVDDGEWHDVAVVWDAATGEIAFSIDGERDAATGSLRINDRLEDAVIRIGCTNDDFPDPSHFVGELEDVRFYSRILTDEELHDRETISTDQLEGWWLHEPVSGETVADLTRRELHGRVVRSEGNSIVGGPIIAGVETAADGFEWRTDDAGRLLLDVPAGNEPIAFIVWTASLPEGESADQLAANIHVTSPTNSLAQHTHGGQGLWPNEIVTQVIPGDESGAFAVDLLAHPEQNPWLAQVRLTGLDFYNDGDSMACCAWDGDVWKVTGFSRDDGTLTWKRIASGLFQPLGIKVIDGVIHVTCRDQLVILRDLNGDGETDFYECLNNDHQVTEHFHEFAMGLQVDEAGNFYYAKSARHALEAVVPHHGTLLRIPPDGSRTDILANGFRAANGVCLNPDGTFIVTDQEGHWNPKNRINWVHEGGFYGNMFGYHNVTDSSDAAMEQPLCWITNDFDRSPAELLWVESDAWGPLNGSLLNLSYGYGQVFVVPHETVNGQIQGGMSPFPLPRLPTGIMRGRFSPFDGQLYTCGMFAWAGNQTQPGGLYRIRWTGRAMHLPIGLAAHEDGISITFTEPLDEAAASDPENFDIKVWSLRRTANYGSEHYDEHELAVTASRLDPDDPRTVHLFIPDIAPTWCMEIRYRLRDAEGERFSGVIHNTIHELSE